MKPYPLQFHPVFKRTIWGGRRLGEQLGKPIGAESDYAESWEVVDHGDDQSVVRNGVLAGATLSDVIASHRQWLLGSLPAGQPFPLLLKYLDCNRVLSVQVHPSDEYGAQMTTPDLGKTEAWFIVSSEPDSLIYAGLKPGTDRTAFEQAIEEGAAAEVLHSFHPDAGDVVFIPAGTVHALGSGLLVAEIQQSSDTTFRLFDWNRVGADGQPRELHLRQGLEVTDYQTGPIAPRRADRSVAKLQTVVECDKFLLRLLQRGSGRLAGDGKFHIVTVPRGSATLTMEGTAMELATGDTALLPAALGQCRVAVGPESTLLEMCLPD